MMPTLETLRACESQLCAQIAALIDDHESGDDIALLRFDLEEIRVELFALGALPKNPAPTAH